MRKNPHLDNLAVETRHGLIRMTPLGTMLPPPSLPPQRFKERRAEYRFFDNQWKLVVYSALMVLSGAWIGFTVGMFVGL